MKKALLLICLGLILVPGLVNARGFCIWVVSGHVGPVIVCTPEGYRISYVPIIDVACFDPFWWLRPELEPRPPIYKGWDLDIFVGYNILNPEDTLTVENPYILNANLDVRYKFPIAQKFYPYLGVGPGFYQIGITETSAFGVNGTAGLGINISPRFSFELGASTHYLFDEPNTFFTQATLGFVYKLSK